MYGYRHQKPVHRTPGKGLSLSRIAERLNIAQRTLVDWNRHEHEQIRALRAIECEALQEKLLATHEQELIRHKKELDRLEAELAKPTVEGRFLVSCHKSLDNLPFHIDFGDSIHQIPKP